MDVRRLPADDVALVATLDRTEHVDIEYHVVHGELREVPVTVPDIPPYDRTGSGPHSVAHMLDFCARAVAGAGVLLGAFDAEQLAGLAIVQPRFEPPVAWWAFVHVTRPFRRRGAGQALWDAAADIAVAAGAESMYVSATPTGSAVGFYLRQGCRLARPVHPDLFALEPDDIHFMCPLR